jgi:hypothetical protein
MKPLALAFLGVCLGLSSPALAQDPANDPSADAEDDMSIEVYGDLFARWDNTRWFIQSEMSLPFNVVFQKEQNKEFSPNMLQTRTIIACNKDWRLSKKKYEVDCVIEDFALLVVVKGKATKPEDGGRVTNISLEGVDTSTRRTRQIEENLRLMLASFMDGFDMKLRKWDRLGQGQWVEYDSALMRMPMSDIGSQGSSLVVNQLGELDGYTVVQSKGRGLLQIPSDEQNVGIAGGIAAFDCKLNGVSVYDRDDGYMVERIYSLMGRATASTDGVGALIWRAGRLRQLDEGERPSVGPTREIAPPEHAKTSRDVSGLPVWVSIEGPG